MPEEPSPPDIRASKPDPAPGRKPISRKVAMSSATVGIGGSIATILQYYLQLPPEVAQALSTVFLAVAGFIVGYFVKEE